MMKSIQYIVSIIKKYKININKKFPLFIIGKFMYY